MHPAVPPGGVPADRGVHCAVFTVDISEFSDLSRPDTVRLSMRQAMYRYLIDAFEFARVPWDEVVYEDRGDGVLVIVPGGFPEASLIEPLLGRLLSGLRTYNSTAAEIARIRLRAALHAGQVIQDSTGLVGEAVNHTCRLLEADKLKETLKATGAELAFITSESLYNQVVRHRQAGIDPDTFLPVTVRVKETSAQAWIHLPGRGPARTWAPVAADAPVSAVGGGHRGLAFYGPVTVRGDFVVGDKHVVAPGDRPGDPPDAAHEIPHAPDRPALEPGDDDERC